MVGSRCLGPHHPYGTFGLSRCPCSAQVPGIRKWPRRSGFCPGIFLQKILVRTVTQIHYHSISMLIVRIHRQVTMIDIWTGITGSPPWIDSFDDLAVSSSDNLELTCGIEKDKMEEADMCVVRFSSRSLHLNCNLAVSHSDNLELTYGTDNDMYRMKGAYINVLPDFIDLGRRFLHPDRFIWRLGPTKLRDPWAHIWHWKRQGDSGWYICVARSLGLIESTLHHSFRFNLQTRLAPAFAWHAMCVVLLAYQDWRSARLCQLCLAVFPAHAMYRHASFPDNIRAQISVYVL